jgi:Ser/Thr protein kinase RdoA (MazF antagonist)
LPDRQTLPKSISNKSRPVQLAIPLGFSRLARNDPLLVGPWQMSEVSYVLSRYLVEWKEAGIERLGAAGGMSGAQFWRISASQGPLILRRWPRGHPTPERLEFIHDVLRHASQGGVAFLPLPIHTADGRTFVSCAGHLWELARWLPGAADYSLAPRPAKLRAALVALAQFHLATADWGGGVWNAELAVAPRTGQPALGPAPAVTDRLARLRELHATGIAALARAIAEGAWPELDQLARPLVEVLPHAAPLATGLLAPLAGVPFALQPCVRDVWHDHVLFVGDEVTGLIDFGAMRFDTPATDVARLLGSLVSDDADGWRRGLEAYAAARPLSPDESRAVAALDVGTTVLAGCNWLRWIYIEKRQFERREQIVQRVDGLLQRLRRLIERGAPACGQQP